jgi:hypothetical protein
MRRLTARRGSTLVAALALAGTVLAGCSDDDEATPDRTTTTEPPATTTTTDPTTTTTTAVPDCTPEDVLAEVDATIAQVRLAAGGEWTLDPVGTAFDDRTLDAESFRQLLALDCAIRAGQTTAGGDERLLLAAWTGERLAFVVQATDKPSTPYALDATFELLIEQPRGEYFAGPHRANRDIRTVWAGTLSGGETVVISADDYSEGATAKAWQAGFERGGTGEDMMTLESERFGFDALVAAGARSVGLAQPAESGSEEGTLTFITPSGQINLAAVAPVGWFDPAYPWHQREVTEEEVGGTTLYISEAGPPDDADVLTYDVAHVSFDCGDWVWHLMTGFGTTEELRDWTVGFIETLDCAATA